MKSRREAPSLSRVDKNTSVRRNQTPKSPTSKVSNSFTIESILSRPNPSKETINSRKVAQLKDSSNENSFCIQKSKENLVTQVGETSKKCHLVRPTPNLPNKKSEDSFVALTPATNPTAGQRSDAGKSVPMNETTGGPPIGVHVEENPSVVRPHEHENLQIHNTFVNFRTSSIQTLRHRAEEHVKQLRTGLNRC